MTPEADQLKVDLDRVVAQTAPLWEELRGRSLFITGGTGFFGNWLLESFARANATLDLRASALVLCRNRNSILGLAPHLRNHGAIRFCQGDVFDFAFPAGVFSHVIHAATTSATVTFHGSEKPLEKFDTVVGGTRRVLDFARQCGAAKFLLTSSGAVYGRQPQSISHLPEEYAGGPDPTDPQSVVPEGKRAAELLCALYAEKYGLETKIARCFSFVGPYLPLDLHYAIGNFIHNALRDEEIVVKGDGSPIRSYLYAADLIVWLLTILMQGKSGRPYNVGSEEAVSIGEVARLVRDTLSPQKQVRILAPHQAPTAAGRSVYVPSTVRARSELHLNQGVALAEAIARTASSVSAPDVVNDVKTL